MRKTTLFPATAVSALACLGSLMTTSPAAHAQVYVDGQASGQRITGYANRAAYTRTGAQRGASAASHVDPYSTSIQSRTAASYGGSSGTDTDAGTSTVTGTTASGAAANSIAMNSIATYSHSNSSATSNFFVDPWYTKRYGARHYYVYRPYPRYRYRSYYYRGYPYYRYYGRRYYGGYGGSYCGFTSGFSFRLHFGDGYRGRSRSYHRPYFDGYRYRGHGNYLRYGTGGLSIRLCF